MAKAVVDSERLRKRAAILSLVVGVLLLGLKLTAWVLTGSTAVLSDALESNVNVIAAAFALYSVLLSGRPADLDHPYGHGKIEFLSAGFEGGLIFLAGGVILYESVSELITGVELQRLGVGLVLVGVAAAVNGVLGLYLIAVGRRTHSVTLVADGKHLLTDVWTSAATLVALGLVMVTDWLWIDPVFAMLAGANIIRIGFGLVREAVAGIMDEADPDDLRKVSAALHAFDDPLFEGWGRLRTRHQGAFHHVDLTLYVPDGTSVRSAHDLTRRVERIIEDALDEADVICHVEPLSLRPFTGEQTAERGHWL